VAVYEVILRFEDREEVRLTDRPLEVGDNLRITGSEWLVQRCEPRPERDGARYICVKPTAAGA
jgi:hypothetical protein